MAIRQTGAGYANAALAAAVTIVTKDGTGAQIATPAQNLRLRIAAETNGVWIKLSKGSVVAATAGTAGEILVQAGGGPTTINMGTDWDNLSIINAAVGCRVSVTPVETDNE